MPNDRDHWILAARAMGPGKTTQRSELPYRRFASRAFEFLAQQHIHIERHISLHKSIRIATALTAGDDPQK